MLPAAHRLTDAPSYRRVLRRGRRRAARTLVVSVLLTDTEAPSAGVAPVRLGLVVSKAVGGSVERNRVKRRLRHLAAPRLEALPAGTEVVVRALPPARGASFADLGRDLDRCLRRGLADALGEATP